MKNEAEELKVLQNIEEKYIKENKIKPKFYATFNNDMNISYCFYSYEFILWLLRIFKQQEKITKPLLSLNFGEFYNKTFAEMVEIKLENILKEREKLIEAFLAETGLLPSECEMVEKPNYDGNGITVFFRRKKDLQEELKEEIIELGQIVRGIRSKRFLLKLNKRSIFEILRNKESQQKFIYWLKHVEDALYEEQENINKKDNNINYVQNVKIEHSIHIGISEDKVCDINWSELPNKICNKEKVIEYLQQAIDIIKKVE